MKKVNFTPDVCPHCGQTTTYLLPVDRGTVEIVKAFIMAVKFKGKNEIHPRREMEKSENEIKEEGLTYSEMINNGQLSSNQVGNLSRPRFHGLIAQIKEKPGFYCLTRKGADFLRGNPISRYVIVSKSEKKNIGYFPGEDIKISDFNSEDDRWEFPGLDIIDGRPKTPAETGQAHLFNLPQIRY